MIHPLSPFMMIVHMISVLLNVWCFFEMPVLIAYYWSSPPCFKPKSFECDMAVEVFFILEMFLGFFVGSYDINGVYPVTHAQVAAKYLRSGHFFFDALTSAPITWVEWILVFRPGCDSDSQEFSLVKAPLRLVRPLRLLKVAKMLRIFKVLQSIEDNGFHLELWQQKILKIAALFFCIIHIFNCTFWLIKEASSSEEDLVDFLIQHNIVPDHSVPGDEAMWFKTDEARFTFERYLLSGYFINTVMTTVGFGDIAGTSAPERMFLIVAMWVGLLLFSLVVGEVEGMVSRSDFQNARRRHVGEFKSFLKRELVPNAVQENILEWVNFSYMVETERMEQQMFMSHLPADLQETLILHLTKVLYEPLPIVTRVAPEHRDILVAHLSRKATFTLVRRGTLIATQREISLGRLFIVVSGRVRLTDQAQTQHLMLGRGDFFGSLEAVDNAVRTDEDQDSAMFFADRSSELAMLTRDLLEDIIPLLPAEAQESLLRVSPSVPLFSHEGRVSPSNAYLSLAPRDHADQEARPPLQAHASIVYASEEGGGRGGNRAPGGGGAGGAEAQQVPRRWQRARPVGGIVTGGEVSVGGDKSTLSTTSKSPPIAQSRSFRMLGTLGGRGGGGFLEVEGGGGGGGGDQKYSPAPGSAFSWSVLQSPESIRARASDVQAGLRRYASPHGKRRGTFLGAQSISSTWINASEWESSSKGEGVPGGHGVASRVGEHSSEAEDLFPAGGAGLINPRNHVTRGGLGNPFNISEDGIERLKQTIYDDVRRSQDVLLSKIKALDEKVSLLCHDVNLTTSKGEVSSPQVSSRFASVHTPATNLTSQHRAAHFTTHYHAFAPAPVRLLSAASAEGGVGRREKSTSPSVAPSPLPPAFPRMGINVSTMRESDEREDSDSLSGIIAVHGPSLASRLARKQRQVRSIGQPASGGEASPWTAAEMVRAAPNASRGPVQGDASTILP
jgi:CRP-like cAMP-binding protein